MKIFYEKLPETSVGYALKEAKEEYWDKNTQNLFTWFLRYSVDLIRAQYTDPLFASDYKNLHSYVLYGDALW